MQRQMRHIVDRTGADQQHLNACLVELAIPTLTDDLLAEYAGEPAEAATDLRDRATGVGEDLAVDVDADQYGL